MKKSIEANEKHFVVLKIELRFRHFEDYLYNFNI